MDINEHSEVSNLVASMRLASKPVLTARECAEYIGVSLKYLYQLTSKRQVPFFKPRGKMLYFKRSEIDLWLTKRNDI